MARERIYLFDTTLRDGQQTPGVDFSLEDKLVVMGLLDEMGVDYIEGGYPGGKPDGYRTVCHRAQDARRLHRLRHDQAGRALGGQRPRRPGDCCNAVSRCRLLRRQGLLGYQVRGGARHAPARRTSSQPARNHRGLTSPPARRRSGRLRALLRWLQARQSAYALALRRGRRYKLPAPAGWCSATPMAAHMPAEDRRDRPPGHQPRGAGQKNSASTPMTIPARPSPTRSPPSNAGVRQIQGTLNGIGERCGNANLVTHDPHARC